MLFNVEHNSLIPAHEGNHMQFSYGTIIALAAGLFFYLRLILLQRQKVKLLQARQASGQKRDKTGKRKTAGTPTKTIPQLQFSSIYLLGAGILLIILGAVISAPNWFSPTVRDYWWIPVTIGILCMTFSIR
jgi:hypothetical protein